MNCAPGFVRTSTAWYAASALGDCAERVCISLYLGSQAADAGELILEWRASDQQPELRVGRDGWQMLLKDFSGLLRHLSRLNNGAPFSPDDLCALLLRLGYCDMTERTRPPTAEVIRLRPRS
jgi:hypothetical protein